MMTCPFDPENIENRVIRIFISSTFSDMQEERDMLISKVFPKLSKIAAQRDVLIVPLDLRWGITDEAVKEGKVIETCLNEIIYSRPFFLGLIGNRYGSCLSLDEARKNEQLLKQYAWLERDMTDGLSITEIEIQYGVLRNPERINAFFYLKDGDVGESDNPTKLSRLKEEIRENGRYPVDDYVTIEDLEEKVESAFMEVLDKYFPEKELSFLEKDRIAQRAFLHSREIAYVPIREVYEVLDGFLEGEEQCFVVTGESGMGKSALVANWLKHAGLLQNKNRKVIYHSVEVGGLNGDYRSIAKRLCDEIRDLYDLPCPRNVELEQQKPEDMLQCLYGEIIDREPLLVVLDGINQLEEGDNAKQLLWLPESVRQVKYLFTTFPDDETMEVFERRDYPVYTLQPLNFEQRKTLVKEYLARYGKELSSARMERIVCDPQNDNTLVLRTLLDELCGFGYHEMLDERIDYYLEASSIEDFFQRILERMEEDLGKQMVSQVLSLITFSHKGLSEQEIMECLGLSTYEWAVFHGVFRRYFVDSRGLLTFSHRYIEVACRVRYSDKEEVARRRIVDYFRKLETEAVWEELAFQYYRLGEHESLYRLLLRFPVFDYFYRNDLYQLGRYWRRLLDVDEDKYGLQGYSENNCDDKSLAGYYYNQLGVFFRGIVVRLTYALTFLKKSEEIYASFESFHPRMATIYNNVGAVYSSLGEYKSALDYYRKALEIYKSHFGEIHAYTALSYNNIGAIYSSIGDYEQALNNSRKALEIREAIFGKLHQDTATSYNNVGTMYYYLKDYTKGLEYCKEALNVRKSIFGEKHLDTAISYNTIGLIYNLLGEEQALFYFCRSLEIRKAILGEKHIETATSYNNVGGVYYSQGKFIQALEPLCKALEIQEVLLGKRHPMLIAYYRNVGNVYYALKTYDQALMYYRKMLRMCKSILGEQHRDTAISYSDIGAVYYSIGDYDQALVYHRKTLEIRESILGKQHQDTATSYNDIGNAYYGLKLYESALDYYQKALEIRKICLDDQHQDLATSYNNVGIIYYSMDKYKPSLEYFHKAFEIRKNILGERHHDTIASCLHLLLVYKSLGEYMKAASYLSWLITQVGNNR